MALTDTALRALKPRTKTYTITDDRGLYVEIFPTGGIIWRYRYRLDGKSEKVTLGRYPDLSLKNARIKRDECAAVVALGESPAKKKQLSKIVKSKSVTFGEFAERFFREVQQRDRKNCDYQRCQLDNDLLPFIGDKAIQGVSVDDVRSIIWRKKEQGFDNAAAQLRSLIKRIFDYAATCGVAPQNPVQTLPTRHICKSSSRDRSLSPGELGMFIQALLFSSIRRQFKLALHLILLTMVRKSELLFALWEEVHFDIGEWHIPASKSKNGRPHIVYLSHQAVSLFKGLQSLAGHSLLVLPGKASNTKHFAKGSLNTALSNALQGHDIPHFTIHDLRRTASTILHEQGWSSDVVEKALNHTIGGVRGVYNRAEYSQQRREMLQSWADYLDNLTGANVAQTGNFIYLAGTKGQR